MEYFNAFLCGGILCLIGQLLIDKTPLTPAKILVLYVVTGVVLGGAGVYQKLVDWAGSGATVPLTGFGYLLAKGVRKAVEEQGFLGEMCIRDSPPPSPCAVCPWAGSWLCNTGSSIRTGLGPWS